MIKQLEYTCKLFFYHCNENNWTIHASLRYRSKFTSTHPYLLEKLEHKGVRGSEPKKILLGRIRGKAKAKQKQSKSKAKAKEKQRKSKGTAKEKQRRRRRRHGMGYCC